MLTSHNQEIDVKNLRRALRDWHSLKALSEHPLVCLEIVQARHTAAAYSESQSGWGLAVRDTLTDAIETLKPLDGRRLYEYRQEVLKQPGRPNIDAESKLIGSIYAPMQTASSRAELKDRTWRLYFIVCEQYLHQRNPEWVAEQLHISKGTYYSEQKIALERLAGVIEKWEDQQCRGEITQRKYFAATALPSYTPFLAPPQPSYNLVGRTELLGLLRQRLIGGNRRPILALHGLPGVGKTAVAIEIAHDSQILEHFKDGILWASLGSQTDILACQVQWAAALGLSESAVTRRNTQAERAQILHAAIGMRCMLLVIDDAWNSEAAQAFHIGGPHCAYLLTTRLMSVALDFSTWGVIPVPELDLVSGLALLDQFVPRLQVNEPAAASKLVDTSGGLPLELVLIGSHLRRNYSGSQPRRLREAVIALDTPAVRLRVTQPDSVLVTKSDQPGVSSRSLQSAIGTSYTGLSLPAQQAWRALALFDPKPNTFSEAAALAITGVPAAALDELVDHSILECQADERFAMHRTIVEYAALLKVESSAVRRMVEYYLAFAAEHAGDDRVFDIERKNLLKTLALAEKSKFQLAGERGMETLIKKATGNPVA